MLTYIFIAILFSVFTSANFFIRSGFFTTATTTDLSILFSAVPYISIIALPALCHKNQLDLYSDFIPEKSFIKISKRFLFLLSIYSVMILLLLIPCGFVAELGTIDAGQIFTSIINLILYGASSIAFCILLGELILNPVVCFAVSALILGIINSAHSFIVYLHPGDFISSFFKQISFAWHFDAASKGVFDTRDFFFFLITSFILLFLSDLSFNLKKGKKYSAEKKYQNILILIVSILVLINSNIFYKRFDLSKTKKYSLTRYSQELTKKFDSNLKITYYRSSNLLKYYPQIRDVSDYLQLYSNQNKKITFSIKNPDNDENVKKLLSDYGVQSQQLRSVKNNSTEYIEVYSAITLEYEGKIELIPFTMDSQSLEYDLDGRIKHLITGKNRIVNIVIGNGMNCTDDYSYLIPWLNSQGFLCNEINIYSPDFESQLQNSEGPLLVIGDSEISFEQAMFIEEYILSEKGKAFFAVSPYSVDIENDWSIRENYNSYICTMLENWGVSFNPSICGDFQNSRIQLYSQDFDDIPGQNNTHTEILNYPMWIKLPSQKNFNSGMTAFWINPLEFNNKTDVKFESYLVTSPSSYLYKFNFDNKDSLLETNPFNVRDNGIPDKNYESRTVCAIINGNLTGYFNSLSSKNAEIMIYSDQYFVNTLMTGYNGTDYSDYRNFDFLTNSLLKLNNESELASIQNHKIFDNTLNKITDVNEYLKLQIKTYLVLFVIIPVLYIVLAVILLIMNKKRYLKFTK